MDSEVRPSLDKVNSSSNFDGSKVTRAVTLLPWRMERSETGAEGDDMESLGPGDGGHGVDYEFEQADKGSLGFVGVDRFKELKHDVRKAWEEKGQGHFVLTPTGRQTGAAEVTPALGCDPEVNHSTEVLRCDASMQEDTSDSLLLL